MTEENYQTARYVPPAEFSAFFDDLSKLVAKHPDAAKRFTLVDFAGQQKRSGQDWVWDCFSIDGWEVCEIKFRPQ